MSIQQGKAAVAYDKVVAEFEERSEISGVRRTLKETSEGPAVIFQIAQPSERFYKIAQDINASIDHDLISTVTIQKVRPEVPLQSPEARYFSRVLAESLNINRYSFGDNFFSRYTKSVSNAEEQIITDANHIVYGRRGAGKSSLLLYALKTREKKGLASTWIDMQAYQKRTDLRLHADVLYEFVHQLRNAYPNDSALNRVEFQLEQMRQNEQLTMAEIRQFIPEIKAALPKKGNIFLFLDDFHVIELERQPSLLGTLYSVARGSALKLKLSAIRTLTKPWDAKKNVGLQVNQDAQTINLDYNLTMPDKASTHIEGILDAHAKYCGLPSMMSLCGTHEVLNRLIWVSAGVPRDALNLFGQAMTKANVAGRERVSVTDINLAASDNVSDKTSEVEADLVGSEDEENTILGLLENIKEFCIRKKRSNAFLIEIKNNQLLFKQVLQLVDLRVIHVISEGITVGQVGRKYLALMLDYGFYTGTRAAQSVVLFNKKTQKVNRSELRKLPILSEQGLKQSAAITND